LTREKIVDGGVSARPLQWTGDLVQKFWNYQSRFPENYFTSLYGDRIAEVIRRYLPSQARVLDYACGTGALTGHLLRAGFVVGGCDLSSDSVAYVRGAHAGNPAFRGAMTIDELLASELKFDAVVLVELVEHVNDAILASVMSDLRRVLAPDGMVIVTTPNDENLDIETVYCPCCDHTFHRWQHVRNWNGATLGEFLASHGFKPLTTVETDFSLSPRVGLIRYGLHRVLGLLRRRRPPHLMVVAKMIPGTGIAV
jgi:2-polyprenyl-3-methyl-5-hydroxy-6-metoxy-1,4-benzoquinol methylase